MQCDYVHFMKIGGIIGAEIIYLFFNSSFQVSQVKIIKQKHKICVKLTYHGQYCEKCKTANSPNNPIHGGCLIVKRSADG